MSIKPHRFCHLFKPFLVFLKSVRELPFTVFIKLPLCFISFLITCLTTWTTVVLLCGDFLWNMVFPCIQCGKEVRPRQHAVDCDWCGQWTHRQCGTGMSIITLRRKKSCLFPLTRPTLVFHADPKVFFSSISEKNRN